MPELVEIHPVSDGDNSLTDRKYNLSNVTAIFLATK